MNTFIQIIFPVFGLLMIVFALGAFFFSYGNRIKESIQRFDFLGIKLEISVITAIIIGGMMFCGIGIYVNEYGFKGKYEKEKNNQQLITDLKRALQDKDDIINSFKSQTITYHLALEDLDEGTPPPSPKSLICVYRKYWSSDDSTIYNVLPSVNGYKVTFQNLSFQEFADASPSLYLYDNSTKKKWACHSFNPLTPILTLKPIRN
ncbi:MAG: hypothetical protein JWN76_484 [Chitinophagaceae bacterium]|nr:hypothetical protein [Chitinophagaceae bacterium]